MGIQTVGAAKGLERRVGPGEVVQQLGEGARALVLCPVVTGRCGEAVSQTAWGGSRAGRNGADGALESEDQLEHGCSDPGWRCGNLEDNRQVKTSYLQSLCFKTSTQGA